MSYGGLEWERIGYAHLVAHVGDVVLLMRVWLGGRSVAIYSTYGYHADITVDEKTRLVQ